MVEAISKLISLPDKILKFYFKKVHRMHTEAPGEVSDLIMEEFD